ncbi:SOS response-associated peptidase [Vibrio lamellibrachiae]|uniref:SOS response-associated peptidase n=1 Tax=Vibrio lamellibrachiae TaxID=2910253 RepID=UPI003D13938F
MCGRFNVIDDPLTKLVSELLDMQFTTQSNSDVRPTNMVSTVGHSKQAYKQLELNWGIKPSWAKRVIINAQAESVSTKSTFREAFENHRVIVPCSGWYEWRTEQGSKRKYLFGNADGSPLYMAGIALESQQKLVTLTTTSNNQCQPYHHRMPFLVPSFAIEEWLTVPSSQCVQLLTNYWDEELLIKHCDEG